MPVGSSTPSLSELGEFGLIQELSHRFGKTGRTVLKGIGDDAAICKPDPQSWLLMTTDLLTEGIHFNLRFQSLEDVGYKTAVANLSDIAAMGGTPLYLLVAMAIPKTRNRSDLHQLYQGLMTPCTRHGVQLIGGDTCASTRNLVITGVIVGKVKPGHALQRQGAKVGDSIYVTGTLGDARAGLALLKSQARKKHPRAMTHAEQFLTQRHLRPTPRLEFARALSSHRLATAAIDLSDGLSGDLPHLCQASQVGAIIWSHAIPLSVQGQSYADQHRQNALELALAGGEDYELVFTSPPQYQTKLARVSKACSVPITCIGEIKPQSFGIQLKLVHGSSRQLPRMSYNHFRL